MNLSIVLAVMLAQAVAGDHPGQNWRAATYKGLTIGKSNRAAMLRFLGKPKWSRSPKAGDEPESGREVWHHYEQTGDMPGTVNILAEGRSGIIRRIDFFPTRLSKQEAIAHFGTGYIVTRYDFDPCPGDEDDEALYESPNGPITSVEYRLRGIAIFVGNKDLVTKISYVNRRIGSVKARCK